MPPFCEIHNRPLSREPADCHDSCCYFLVCKECQLEKDKASLLKGGNMEGYTVTAIAGSNKVKIEITHTCSHVQVFARDAALFQKGEKIMRANFEWLSNNLCPGCYCLAKDLNPSIKPAR